MYTAFLSFIMKTVCCIYHGSLTFPNNSTRLEDLIPFGTQFYNHRPRMIRYKKDDITLLIFTSFKFRLMGKGENHLIILHEFMSKLPWKCHAKSNMTLNMTITHQLLSTHINLHKLNRHYFQVEMELFPAAKLIHCGREHVNIFHNGHIVITGARNMENAQYLINQVLKRIQ